MIQKFLAAAIVFITALSPSGASESHAQFNQGRICNYSSSVVYVSVTPPRASAGGFKTLALEPESCTAPTADAEIIWALRCEDSDDGEGDACSNWNYKIGWGELRVCDSDEDGWLRAERRSFGAQGWASAEARNWYVEPTEEILHQLEIQPVWEAFTCGL